MSGMAMKIIGRARSSTVSLLLKKVLNSFLATAASAGDRPSLRSSPFLGADNLFLFRLTEESDLTHVSPAKVDPETIIQVAKALPSRRCLVVREVTNHYPFIVDVTSLDVKMAGATRKYFEVP